MDVFNRLVTQINDLFKSMSPGARLTAGLLLVAVVVSIGYLFNAQSSGAEAYLLNGQSFTADDMARMEAAFGKASLSDYTVEGSRIKVSEGRKAAFLGALADAGAMPAHFGDYLSTAAAGSAFESREQRELKVKAAKQQELALVIRAMNGVENASVQYDVQKGLGFGAPPIKTASVGVKMGGQVALAEAQVQMIRSLVAAAIAGLQPEQVTIVDLNGNRTYSSNSSGGGSALDDAYLSRVREYQNLYESQIRGRLAGIPGVVVTASVDLDREMVKKTVESNVQQKPVAVRTETIENSSTSNSAAGPAGRPGFATQQPGANTPGSIGGGGGGTHKEDTQSTNIVESVPSHGQTTTQHAGLTPKRVAVSIGVPSNYFDKLWLLRNPPPAGQEPKKPDQAALTAIQDEELKNIREAVKPLIPLPVDAAPGFDVNQLITVSASPSVPLPEPVGPSLVNNVIDWLAGSWSSVAMIGLALMALLMLRSFVRSVPAAPELPSVMQTTVENDEPAEAAAAATGDAKESAKQKTRSLQRKAGGPSLREELVDMVREDPEAAANILRGWIGSAT